MASSRSKRRSGSKRFAYVQKPGGVIHPRVEAVGPTHFGIVAIDCAKARSKWMLADFYGNVRVPPTTVAHTQGDFDAALTTLRQSMQTHQIKDVLVAVERTGRYHQVPQRAFVAGGFEVRIVHPFATKQFRLPADPGNKTDDTDLRSIHRAAVNGFALVEAPPDLSWQELQLLIRHRRDWVEKVSALCCQVRDHLDAALPGYAACFGNFWSSEVAFCLARRGRSAEGLRTAGVSGMIGWLREASAAFQERTVHKVLAWAQSAAPPGIAAARHLDIALALEQDRAGKSAQIQGMEREIAGRLARTPYVFLLSIPGINVVSAGDYAGEMGPIQRYANSRTITGRAGLYPARYQSDEVDHADGALVRCANHTLRAAILQAADNLITCNKYFAGLAARWKATGKDPRWTHVKVGCRFCRISYQMVAGGQVFRHPCAGDRHYILRKLMEFHREHGTPTSQVLNDLQAVIDQLPRGEYAGEAAPLAAELEAIQNGRRRNRRRPNSRPEQAGTTAEGDVCGGRPPQAIGEILPLVLARLGIGGTLARAGAEPVQSTESGAVRPA